MLILEAQRAETGRERERKGGLWDVDSVQFVKIHQALNLHFVHFSVHMLYFNIKFPNNFVFVVQNRKQWGRDVSKLTLF